MAKPKTPKAALVEWAEKNEVTPANFALDMDYTYNHAYQLLRGDAEVTPEMLGRFIITYGTEAAQPLVDALTTQVNPKPKKHNTDRLNPKAVRTEATA